MSYTTCKKDPMKTASCSIDVTSKVAALWVFFVIVFYKELIDVPTVSSFLSPIITVASVNTGETGDFYTLTVKS